MGTTETQVWESVLVVFICETISNCVNCGPVVAVYTYRISALKELEIIDTLIDTYVVLKLE